MALPGRTQNTNRMGNSMVNKTNQLMSGGAAGRFKKESEGWVFAGPG